MFMTIKDFQTVSKHLHTLSPNFCQVRVGCRGDHSCHRVIDMTIINTAKIRLFTVRVQVANDLFGSLKPRILGSQRRELGFRFGKFLTQTSFTGMRAAAPPLKGESAVTIKNVVFLGDHAAALLCEKRFRSKSIVARRSRKIPQRP
ncbi:hypothetical protein CKO_01897 [Citrobacter koseri ATCC BAA-895]|uniref:Uncharacterized protein n=1 Tax=Citrobacter koseri (strain ATCC BAA-895 / CDC 4225-83 / SGSC4696) TaxID=290338 RepID=A8AHR2_CITK8|nr:hypothetical protein CKO_01897 [Citrobacter koseri ATCC BAA-895]